MAKTARRSIDVMSSLRKSESRLNISLYDLNKESDRKRTFEDNKWMNHCVQGSDLAKFGCYYFKKPDVVRCQYCFVELSEFEPNDDVLREHLKFSPNCPLLTHRKTLNEPLDKDELYKLLPPVTQDECGIQRRKKSRIEDDVAHPEYRLISNRMKSFDIWPVGIKQKPEELCEAGFFYSGQSDYTLCFACGVYVGNWEPDDNPWVEHKKLQNKECSYLEFNKETLSLNEKKYEQALQTKQKAELEESKTSINLALLKLECDDEKPEDRDMWCKICLSNKSSIALLPCKHVAVCGQCIFGIKDTCPVCRTVIKEKINLIYS